MEHDSGGGLGTHLADKRGRSGRKDRAVRQEIRISPKALSKRNVRHLRQMASGAAHVNAMWLFPLELLMTLRRGKLLRFVSLTPPGGFLLASIMRSNPKTPNRTEPKRECIKNLLPVVNSP